MTRKEAIELAMKACKETWNEKTCKKIRDALEQESCEDAVSRQAVIDTIESWLSRDDYNEAERHIMRATQSVLYGLPSVRPQEQTGYWMMDDTEHGHCSICEHKEDLMDGKSSYGWCSNCGAKMVEPQAESEDKE